MKGTAEKLCQSFYTDNCVTSLEEVEVPKFILESREILAMGKFDLRSWVAAPLSNSVPEYAKVSVLGVQWDTTSDTLCCSFNQLDVMKETRFTKRSLLSMAHRLFDPIGFTAPTSLIPKLILQRAWLENYNWDDELPQTLTQDFKIWLEGLEALQSLKIPRRLTAMRINECSRSLHIFCDACKDSYATCIFLRTELKGIVDVNLVLAKARVAPSKQQITIPRLELLAALIGTRLRIMVQESLKLDCDLYYWTDSSVVLTWIKECAQWDKFVKNRVDEIRSSSNVSDWRHIPGSVNPADLVCRGCNPRELVQSSWWSGPLWLKENKNTWPHTSITDIVVTSENVSYGVNINIDTTMKRNFTEYFTKFSKYSRIIRIFAFVLRFISHCLKKSKMYNNKYICYSEYNQAEKKLFAIIQHESYSGNLFTDKHIQCFKDKDGILRVSTKLLLTDYDCDLKKTVLLPSKHFIVERYVREYHERILHAGVQTLITSLRCKVWICGVRRLSRKVINSCVICKRFSVKHFETPIISLPLNRVKETAAVFETTGIDLAGPLYLKSGDKVYIVLFTCAVFRAVHLELAESLSTEAFIRALRRFIARRGRIHTIYSDNGSNFTGTQNLFKKLDWKEIEAETAIKQIRWIFNPPTAAWWGGWFERLVRVVKDLLRRVLSKARLNYIELSTILCDVEAVVNSRPLTYVGQDDTLTPLTPATFLHELPTTEVSDLDAIDVKSLVTQLKRLQSLRVELRSRFHKEYLALLVHRGRRAVQRPIQIGDVVLIESDSKRAFWPMGRVIKIFPGNDGWPRVAEVRTSTGYLTRPVQRLYPLELPQG